MLVGMLEEEPLQFESWVSVLDEALELEDMDYAVDLAKNIAEYLLLTPVTKPLLFRLPNREFCMAVLRIGKQVITASKI